MRHIAGAGGWTRQIGHGHRPQAAVANRLLIAFAAVMAAANNE
jgi:hypothetical protein